MSERGPLENPGVKEAWLASSERESQLNREYDLKHTEWLKRREELQAAQVAFDEATDDLEEVRERQSAAALEYRESEAAYISTIR